MTHLEKNVLIALYRAYEEKKDTQPIYSYLSQKGRVDDLLQALIHLERMGLVTVLPGAWTYENSLPYDVVMSAVMITHTGKQVAGQLLQRLRGRPN